MSGYENSELDQKYIIECEGHHIANRSAIISELKKTCCDCHVRRRRPIAILNHSKPSFYCTLAAMLDVIEDRELANTVRSRRDEEEVEVSQEDL
ncbi:MAG TPA: antitoxin [Buttiauxella sp.]|jgi:antitoxin StbD